MPFGVADESEVQDRAQNQKLENGSLDKRACFLTHLNLSFPDTEKDEKPACIEQSSSAFVKHIYKKFFKSYAKTRPRKTSKK